MAESADRPGLQEGLLIARQQLDRHVDHGDVTVLVDAELLADDRLLCRNGDLAGEGSVADALAGSIGDLDRLEDVLERSSTIDRIRRRRIMTELSLSGFDLPLERPRLSMKCWQSRQSNAAAQLP